MVIIVVYVIPMLCLRTSKEDEDYSRAKKESTGNEKHGCPCQETLILLHYEAGNDRGQEGRNVVESVD